MKKVQLFIDTTIRGAVIGLKHIASKEVEYCLQTDDVADSAKMLPLMVHQGLTALHSSMNDVCSIIVSRGPGSFTGIRVGLAYAFGLKNGLSEGCESEVKVFGVSSLLELHRCLEGEIQKKLVLFLPSTKTTGYAVVHNNDSINLAAIDCSEEFFASWKCRDWVVVGDWPALEEAIVQNRMVLERKLSLRTAAELALKAMVEGTHQKVDDGSYDDVKDPSCFPDAIYLRGSSVEENHKKKMG